VVYDAMSGERAARLFWFLELFGHEAVSMLDGGFTAWESAGLRVAEKAQPATRGNFKAQPRRDLLATADDILERLGDSGTVIVDARSSAENRGELVRSARGGRIPGAVHLEWKENLDPTGRFKSAEALAAQYAAIGATPDTESGRVERIRRTTIFARISPEQKFLIVDALKSDGAIVAMTGDGVNDAPALHRADIGIAMGQRGTDVARATADLVLLEDNFASIVATVREGRHIFQNIQRAFLYLIAFHIPIVVLAISAPLINVPLVLLPIHLVWLELIVRPVSAIVFQAEPASADIMNRPPRDPAAPLLPRAAVIRSAVSGAMLAAASFAMYWWLWPSLGEAQARALALIVLLAGYQTLIFAERLALPALAVERIPRTLVFWTVWAASAVSLLVILYIPAAAQMFRVEHPPGVHVAVAILLGVLAVGWRLLLRTA
jgi:Ca2+-transporting ATPase